jgi:hypothetical protein
MVAACFEAGGTAAAQVVTSDAGQSWSTIGSDNVYGAKWTGKSSFWFYGVDGIFQYEESGQRKADRTGNFFDVSGGSYVAGLELIA